MKLITALTTTLLGLVLVAAPATADPDAPDVQGTEAAQVSRTEMINRAKVWLTANNGKQVPYDQGKVWKDGYRQDCSGYVSMAAKLPKSGPNTVALFDSHTVPVSITDLKPGDLFIDKIGDSRNRHVVIFEKWTDAKRTVYMAYDQNGSNGTTHKPRTYGLEKNSEYKPRRLKNITG